MTGGTHKAGGMLMSIVGFALLKNNNLLASDVNLGLQWLVIYPFCMWGSVASDLDHNADVIPMKDYPSKLVNKALHITKPIEDIMERDKKSFLYKFSHFFNARHRSWQTHSDLTLAAMIFLLYQLLTIQTLGPLGITDLVILRLVLTGICIGVLAHFLLDIITPEGIWLTGFCVINKLIRHKILPEKLHLVPKGHSFFATGGKWEMFVRKVLQISTWIALAWLLVSVLCPNWTDYIPYTITFG